MAAPNTGLLENDVVDDLLYSSRAGELSEVESVLQRLFSNRRQSTEAPVEAGKDDIPSDALEALLNDVQEANEGHNSPLHYAAANGHADIIGYFLPRVQLSALLAQNESGNTPLHWAAFNGHMEIVKSLVDRIESLVSSAAVQDGSADQEKKVQSEAEKDAEDEREAQKRSVWDVVNKAGRGPMSEAQMNGKEAVVDFLLQRMITAPSSSTAPTEAANEKGDASVEQPSADEEKELSKQVNGLSVNGQQEP